MKLKTKFLLILCFLAIGISGVTYIVSVINARSLTQQQAQGYTTEVKKKFDNLTQQNINMLSLGASFFVANAEIKDAFIAQDRDLLYNTTLPLFQETRDTYGLTNLNFIAPDGTVFLRMQDPGTHDDRITRHVLTDAIASQKISSSLELGKNAFALRIVTPYRNGDTVIGYIEMAREIGNLLETLSHDTEDAFATYGKKEFLDHEDYIASIQRKSASDTWDDFPDDVLLTFNTQQTTRSCLQKKDLAHYTENEPSYTEITHENKTLFCTGFPISDSEGHQIATVIAAHDITPIIATHQQVFSFELLTIIMIFVIFVIIFYIILHKFVIAPTQTLTRAASAVASGDLTQNVSYISKDEIGELTRFFNVMVTRLASYQEKITQESQRLQRHVKEITQKNHQLDESQHATMRALDQIKAAKTFSDTLAHDLQKFKMAADSTSDFVVITDIEGSIVYANTAAERISGLTFAHMQKDSDVIRFFWGGHSDKKRFHEILKKISTQKSFSCTVKNITKEESEYFATISIAPILNENNDTIFVVSIGKDVTREKEMEMAKDNFISLVSHQLRTPLTSIKWMIELLLDPETGKFSKKQKKFLDTTYASVNRLAQLVSDILSINRIEMDRIRIAIVPTDLKKLIAEICAELHDQYQEKSQMITLQPTHALPKVPIDPILMRQAITNILSNAIKYTPEHGTITCNILLTDDHTIIEVADSGIGIPPQDQERIFERFFRASNVQTKYTDGTGLGLFITKMIVEMCNGAITFRSKLHHGTTVQITLPRKK